MQVFVLKPSSSVIVMFDEPSQPKFVGFMVKVIGEGPLQVMQLTVKLCVKVTVLFSGSEMKGIDRVATEFRLTQVLQGLEGAGQKIGSKLL
ncbi:hypothetical protein FGO68_gene9134 [Halteria grandinella]|uniref:Uncharacterized protein n=1 Tax=Halteria grandinella TaxID=5974 RepID=A0A8J8NAK9_HALGN|nr:hypothetical protein FGO68_gene9134 [Halteria grandinella]